MSKSNLRYSKEKIIKNGNTTIVYENADIKRGTELDTALIKAYDTLDEFLSIDGYTAQGVSKLSENDQYDEKKGLIVASLKAELLANKAFLKDLKNIDKDLNGAIGKINNVIDNTLYKIDEINSKLEEM